MKKVLKILFLTMLIVSLFQIGNMYALYKNELSGEYKYELGTWLIKLNDIDISSSANALEFQLTDENFQYVESDIVKQRTIAPGTKGYFNLVIDPSKTDVSVKFDINLKWSEISKANIVIDHIESYLEKAGIENEENALVKTGENTYTGIIPIEKINNNYKNHIKVYFKWENSEENNERDTNSASLGNQTTNPVHNKINIPIEMTVSQYTGEAI